MVEPNKTFYTLPDGPVEPVGSAEPVEPVGLDVEAICVWCEKPF